MTLPVESFLRILKFSYYLYQIVYIDLFIADIRNKLKKHENSSMNFGPI